MVLTELFKKRLLRESRNEACKETMTGCGGAAGDWLPACRIWAGQAGLWTAGDRIGDGGRQAMGAGGEKQETAPPLFQPGGAVKSRFMQSLVIHLSLIHI